MIKKFIFFLIVVFSTVFLSGCSQGSELFRQALKNNTPKVSEIQVDSKAPVVLRDIEDYGYVLETEDGKVLYTRRSDSPDYSTCYHPCELAWEPFVVDSMDQVSGEYSAFDRGGVLQVTYKGYPLYTYSRDDKHEVSGDGYEDMWDVVKIALPPNLK